MEPTTTLLTGPFTPEQELRLAALDRAINRLRDVNVAHGPEDVVAVAAMFEQYIKG